MECRRMLIVDDSATSRMIIRRCFEMAGYGGVEFHEAADGLSAMSFLAESDVDLIVTDLKMPKMDGNTFIKKMRLQERFKRVPIVVISSMGNDVVEAELLSNGATVIIRKPVSPMKISEALGEPA